MGRQVTGTLFRRGRTYWCRFKYQKRPYAFSLKTDKEGHAKHELNRLMTLRKAAIIDGTFFEKFDRSRVSTTPIQNGKLLLRDAWQRYVNSHIRDQCGDETLNQYRYQFDYFISWMTDYYPQAKYLTNVTEEMAFQFLTHLDTAKKLTANTFNKYRDTLDRTFRALLAEMKIARATPWVMVVHRRWNKKASRRKAFTVEMMKVIMSRATGWIRTLFILGFYTGQRLGDCCRVRWIDIDFDHDRITVIPEKTKASSALEVRLPMHPELRRHLETLRMNNPKGSGFILPDVAAGYDRDESSLVGEIQDFLRDCGIPIHRDGTGVNGVRAVVQYGFHSCRHTFVSICRNSGTVSDAVIKSIVGNSYGHYTHDDEEQQRKAIEQLPYLTDGDTGVKQDRTTSLSISAVNAETPERMRHDVPPDAKRRLVEKNDPAA